MPTNRGISTQLHIGITLPAHNHPCLFPKGHKVVNPTLLVTALVDRVQYQVGFFNLGKLYKEI